MDAADSDLPETRWRPADVMAVHWEQGVAFAPCREQGDAQEKRTSLESFRPSEAVVPSNLKQQRQQEVGIWALPCRLYR